MKKILCMVLCLCLLIPAMVCAERKVVTAVAAEINPDNLKSVLVDARIRAYNKEDSTITVCFRLLAFPRKVMVWHNLNGRHDKLKNHRDGTFSLTLQPSESVFLTFRRQ